MSTLLPVRPLWIILTGVVGLVTGVLLVGVAGVAEFDGNHSAAMVIETVGFLLFLAGGVVALVGAIGAGVRSGRR